MNQKIIILIGVSGSGKSFWTKEYRSDPKNKKAIVVSRDSIRMSLFGYSEENLSEYYLDLDLRKNEEIVTKFADNQIWYALQNGFDVIADNTHLRQSYINSYKQFGVELMPQWFPYDEKICVERDSQRSKKVGEDVIKKQIKQFDALYRNTIFWFDFHQYNALLTNIYETCRKQVHDLHKPDCYIFDIDNTLAHKNDRGAFDYHRVHEDSVDESVKKILLDLQKAGEKIVICSGREGTEECKKNTELWLRENDIVYSSLFFRPEKRTMEKDWMIKAYMWREIQKIHNIIGLFDDRVQVVNIGRRLGYKMIEVDRGDF